MRNDVSVEKPLPYFRILGSFVSGRARDTELLQYLLYPRSYTCDYIFSRYDITSFNFCLTCIKN